MIDFRSKTKQILICKIPLQYRYTENIRIIGFSIINSATYQLQ